MDMTKDYLNRLLELDAPNQIDYMDRKFVDKQVTALPREITANSLKTSTLTSIVDYIAHKTDGISTLRFVIHAANYNEVHLYREFNVDKNRDHLISASIDNCRFPFGQFMTVEQFIINLQSEFIQDDNTKSLLEFVGSVKDDTSVLQKDDGVSQKVVANSGVSLARSVTVPNPVHLSPFRTFSEIPQPESAFVFRIKKDESRGTVMAALFEADGSAWKHTAIIEIQEFLREQIGSADVIILA